MNKKIEIIDRIIEYGVYLYIILMFLSKGETIRSILIFGNFALWVFTLKHRKNLYLLKEPVSILCWTYLAATIVAVIFSIDPLYSLFRFKMDPLIFAALFPVIATVMSDEIRLRKTAYVCLFTAIFISGIGYYSYAFHDIPMLKPDIALMHVYHNKFAKYLNTVIPFAFLLFFVWKKPALKLVLAASAVILILALVLNTSKGGYISFFSMALIWTIYIVRKRGHNLVRLLALVVAVIIMVGTVSWFIFPDVKNRFTLKGTINDRTYVWRATTYGIKERPFLGWGYGKEIFHKNEPFENTPIKESPHNSTERAPFDDPHNTFLTLLFHQGTIGFIPYVLLILISIRTFWKEALKKEGIAGYMLVACVAVLVGNYILHAMVSLIKLRYLAVVIGLGMAAKGIGSSRQDIDSNEG